MSIPCDELAAAAPDCNRLAGFALFDALTAGELDELSGYAVEKTIPRGGRLFLEGERPRGLYLLLLGSVKLYKSSACGREVMLSLIHAPASVAETALFDGEAYPASAMAMEDCVVAFLGAEDFRRLCRRFPAIPMEALRLAGMHMRQLSTTIERIRFASLRERLAAELLEHPDGLSGFPLTHQELASRLGTAREVVSRAIGRLRALGIVEITGRRIEILDREALRREAIPGAS